MEGPNTSLVFRQGGENEAFQNLSLHKHRRPPRSGSDRLSIMWQVNTHAHTSFPAWKTPKHAACQLTAAKFMEDP